jgi:hypothetical protein
MASKVKQAKQAKYVVVRTYSAGVHVGELDHRNGKEVVLLRARRIWSWTGAFTLSAIAVGGVGAGSRLSVEVPEITLTEAIEVIVTEVAAEKNLREFPAHNP